MKTLFHGRLPLAVCTASPLFFGSAFTFGAGKVLEEIVVTAQKREQSLKDVPISVNVIGGDFLETSSLGSLQEFSQRMPTLNIAESATGDQIDMRGVGSAVNPGFEQSG